MNIFNSLGSNYDLPYVLRSFSSGSKKDNEDLKNLLEKKYEGMAELFYKGREALTLALKILNLPEDSQVAINGFTCVAVFNAIRKVGLEPFCLDLEETGDLNFTAATLEKVLSESKKIKAVVIQNTLGFPCDIDRILKLCQKYNLILIEDLAHCVGARYVSGREAGTVGDFVTLSFSQDKVIDAVSGGALVIRNKKYANSKALGAKLFHPSGGFLLRDRFYPLETHKIRIAYKFGLGKPYHFILKKLNLLSNVMNESFYETYSLPSWHASLALYQFGLLEKQLRHRRKIAEIYTSLLPGNIFMFNRKETHEAVLLSSSLRFPIFVENREDLVDKLKKNGAYLSDIWYTDVAPECPNAVKDSKIILNLPTHINVSERDAKRIADIINRWIKKQ